MKFGVRILPVTIFLSALLLTVKVGGMWQSMTEGEEVRSARNSAVALNVANATEEPPARNPFTNAALAQKERPLAANVADGSNAIQTDTLLAEERADARIFDSTPLQLAQAAQDGPPLLSDTDGAFDAFDDEPPEGFVGAEVTDEEDLFEDLASLTPGELRLLHDLAGRREAIERKEREITDREALLRAAEQQLVVRQEQLEAVRDEIAELVNRYKEEQDGEQERLRQIYSAMKAKSAAAIFNNLDNDTVIGVMRGMSARRLAPILAAMNPRKAQQLTSELARREELPILPN